MADLWKNGDVITADKLNRIVFCECNESYDSETQTRTFTLNITPDDVFDEDNFCKANIIIATIKYQDQSLIGLKSIIISNSTYNPYSSKYHYNLSGFGNENNYEFDALERSDFFGCVINENEGTK